MNRWMTGLTLTAALSALTEALDDTFNEATDLLPEMVEAYKAQKAFPRRNPSIIGGICTALSFVDNGKPQFVTLAHLGDDGKISYQMEEALVWIALDAATCTALEDNVRVVKSKRGFFDRFRDRPTVKQDDTVMAASIHMLMRNTQSIAIRAAFLANFIRHSIEHIARISPANAFEGSKESAQRHLENYQRQIEGIAPNFTDRAAALDLIKTLSMPFTPIIISRIEDDTCEKLNGIPMSREHASAWRNYFGKVQASARA